MKIICEEIVIFSTEKIHKIFKFKIGMEILYIISNKIKKKKKNKIDFLTKIIFNWLNSKHISIYKNC